MVANLTLTYGSLNLTASPFLLEFGMDVGAPQNVTEALAFLLQDGEVELTDRTSNRTIVFTVLVEGANLTALAAAEASLMGEADKPMNTLTVDPGDSASATVFETYRAQVVMFRDDDYERAGFRAYQVTLRAMPAGRSAAQVTATALPAAGATTTLVNNGSATTNWTGAINGTTTAPSVVSGAVKVSSAAITGTVVARLTYTAAITTSSTKYLVVDWKPETPAGAPDLRVYGDGTELTLMAKFVSPTAGFTRSWYYVPASSIAALRLDSSTFIKAEDPALVRSLYVDNINVTDVRPSFGSARQSMRAVDVAGSARTQGTLAVEHATNALGDVIVYTFPDGNKFDAYSPPLRQYRVVASSGTATVDATRVSGSWDDIKSPSVSTYDIPLANLVAGSHLLVARIASGTTTPTTHTWTAATYINGTLIGAIQTGTFTTAISTTANTAAARIILPTTDVDPAATNAVARITIGNSSTTGSSPQLDEAWLFNTTIGQLTMVSCGTGTAASGGPARRLFIDPPTVDRPRPSLRIGHAADKSDSFYPVGAVASWESPLFCPPRARAFVVTSNATDPTITLKHFPRWHTNAAS